MNDAPDPRFLSFFLREPIYVVEPAPLPVPEPAPPAVPKLPHRGAGRREVLLLVEEPNHEFLSPDDQAFLEKILPAVSLTTDDVVLINGDRLSHHRSEGFTTDQLLAPFPYRTCLILGNAPDYGLPTTHTEKYVVQEAAGRQYLFADALSAIAGDVEKKGLLWNGLQQLFRLA